MKLDYKILTFQHPWKIRIHHNIMAWMMMRMLYRDPKGLISCIQVHIPSPPLLTDQFEKHNLCRGYWGLASCKASSNSLQWLQGRQIRGHESPLWWQICSKNTNFVVGTEDLVPIKFPRKCSVVEEEAGRLSLLADRPKKKHDIGHRTLNTCFQSISSNSVQQLHRKVKSVSVNQRPWWPS